MTALRTTLIAFVATAAFTVGAVAVAGAGTHDNDSGTPQHGLRDFLVSAVAEHNGFQACRYVTHRSQVELLAREPRGMSCEAALSSYARLTLGGERVDSEAAVKALAYRAQHAPDGRERVTVSANGDSRSFVLRRATRAELGEFAAPSTPWRVDGGLAGLLTR